MIMIVMVAQLKQYEFKGFILIKICKLYLKLKKKQITL